MEARKKKEKKAQLSVYIARACHIGDPGWSPVAREACGDFVSRLSALETVYLSWDHVHGGAVSLCLSGAEKNL